ncbi:Uncharacterised protein [Mycobacteroides abscessus subsp. abscessus]|nr:Uncharacterised protein [Mycobacteroides abscessus subsp. abscessus]
MTVLASSDARNNTALATSTGSTQGTGSRVRWASTAAASSIVGCARSGRSLAYTVSLRIIGVATEPGCTRFTRMPRGPSSLARVRARPTTACLLAA